MGSPAVSYPWYSVVSGDSIEQGDILEACPVFSPPDEFIERIQDTKRDKESDIPFRCEFADVIVVSQSCDMVKGHEKLKDVLLCALWRESETKEGSLASLDLENVRKGRYPAYQVIARCDLPGHPKEVRIVDFRRIYSLPLSFVRTHVGVSERLRLMPPYREHLSQALARYFMRVGLPVDIPSFTSKK